MMARPRKSGNRTKSGRLSRAYKGPARDTGTAELQAKRTAIVGGGDPALSATAVGILYANGQLDQQQYDAATRYRSLHAAIFGTPWPKPEWGPGISEPKLVEIQEEFDRKAGALTVEQKSVITSVAVFDHIPTWFFARRTGLKELPEDHRERALLVTGLDAILGRDTRTEKAA